MISRTTGAVSFGNGLHIVPHCIITSLTTRAKGSVKSISSKLFPTNWQRHILGSHPSEFGVFEVEALTTDNDRIFLVLLSHLHPFYCRGTPNDAERRTFHEGILSTDLAGQKEFSWGETLCRLDKSSNQDWLVIAYHREAHVPHDMKQVLSTLTARETDPVDKP